VAVPEREAKLVITAERPEAIADAIAALTSLAGQPLAPAGTVVQRDIYFDTPAGALRARRQSLRLRVTDMGTKLTLKGEARDVDSGVTERDELEREWSAAAFEEARAALARGGIALAAAPATGEPSSVLAAAGLARVQERETRRRLRLAGAGAPIAEVAIDEVTYRLASGPVRHHEVEIEAKADAGADYLPRAVKDLRAQFGGALVSSRHSKLAIGAAIERLLAAPGGVGLMAGDRLTPAGYARVDALLSAEPAPPDAG
jgi:inorganic triphosphatase YgiF